MTATTIALVDDHRLVSRSLKAFLETFPDLRVVGVAASGEELLARMDEWQPQIVLQDLLLPGGESGIDVTRVLRERWPSCRVIALTASTDEARMIGVLRAGACGYVRKDAEPEVLLAAVRAVARGRTFVDPAAAHALIAADAHELTAREIDVLRHVASGRSNREIAAALGVGEETVKTHVTNLLAKLDAENRAQATVQALKRGIVTIDEIE